MQLYVLIDHVNNLCVIWSVFSPKNVDEKATCNAATLLRLWFQESYNLLVLRMSEPISFLLVLSKPGNKLPLKAPEEEEDKTSVDALVGEVLLELDGKFQWVWHEFR